METQNRNMGGNLSYRNSKVGSKKSGPQVKPLREVGGLPGSPSKPKPRKGFNEPSPQPRMQANVTSHSSHTASKSKHYHEKVVGKSGKLNPTKTLPAVRSFPGLANGE
jgi:hypothetical protein